MLDLVAAFIVLTTLLTYVNYRFIRLPPTIGVMATALIFTLVAISTPTVASRPMGHL